MCFLNEDEESVLYWQWDMMDLAIDFIEKELEKSGSMHNNFNDYKNYDLSDNITSYQYEAAGEMFIYLMLCPKFMLDWKTFYIDLIHHASPDVILQTLNRILIIGRRMKSRKDEINVEISKKIIKKIEIKFALNFQAIAKFYNGNPMITIENTENPNLSSNILTKVKEAKENLTTELNIQGNSCALFKMSINMIYQALYKHQALIQSTSLIKQESHFHLPSYHSVNLEETHLQ